MRQAVLLVLILGGGACRRAELVQSFPDNFVGVGMELRIDGDDPVVVRTLEGGSAREAGVQPGDRVEMIDGWRTRGESLGDVVMRIRGRPDTQVTLTVNRDGERIIVVVRRRSMEKRGEDYRRIK